MFQDWRRHGWHYLAVIIVGTLLTLPHIGRTTLWDDDEALNAEAAREMYETGEWIVPTFNFRLRDAKPVLLYWCQIASYHAFGVNEFAARFPSAIAYILAGLFTYELGRRMFSPIAGLLGAIILQSTSVIVWLGGFASHDALLLACTTLTFLVFWIGYAPVEANGPPRTAWMVPCGIVCGFGMLAKGPIGIVLPATVIGAFLIWQRQAKLLWSRRLILGLAAFFLVVAPWYTLVSVATRGAFARGFFVTNNIQRLHTPMEFHGGSVFYHPVAMFLGFVPWSIFLLPILCSMWSRWRSTSEAVSPSRSAPRLLLCWIASYLLFFTVVATKLPHYTAPLYPAMALILGRFLWTWCERRSNVPRWAFVGSFAILAVVGIAMSAGLIWLSRSANPPGELHEIARWCWIGVPPFVFSIVAMIGVAKEYRRVVLAGFLACHLFDLTVIGQGIMPALDRLKPASDLVLSAKTRQPSADIRLATFQYTGPSLVFYSQREVRQLHSLNEAAEFLNGPLPAYLFLSEQNWRQVEAKLSVGTATIVAQKYDPFRQLEVVVVSNRPGANEMLARGRND